MKFFILLILSIQLNKSLQAYLLSIKTQNNIVYALFNGSHDEDICNLNSYQLGSDNSTNITNIFG